MSRPCVICLEDSSPNNPLWQCPEHIEHVCCHDCLGRYVQGRVEQGYSDMRCPCGECDYVFHDDDLLPLLPPKTAEHLGNLRLLHSSPRAVRCPECGTASEGDPKRPHMDCSKCNTQFCFHHGLDHPPGKCPRKRTPFRPLGRAKTWLWKKLRTRKCDHCGFRIERNGGCNHMTCRCGHEFCWHCKSTEPQHVWIIYPTPEEIREISICNHWSVWVYRVAGAPVVIAFGVALVGVVAVAFPAFAVFAGVYNWRLRRAQRRQRAQEEKKAASIRTYDETKTYGSGYDGYEESDAESDNGHSLTDFDSTYFDYS